MLVNNVEADDIIGVICLLMKNYNYKKNIYIISSDKDFLQLGRKNIKFINFKNKNPIVLNSREAKAFLLKRIIFGDNSDCIKPIFYKSDIPKKYKKIDILCNKNLLYKIINNNSKIKKIFNINKKIIDFNYIPKKYITSIIENFKLLFSIK